MSSVTLEQTRGKFIVLEGGDSTGKNTQAKLLLKHLKLQKLTIEFLSFPQYDTPFGELIAKYLRGEYGRLHEVAPEIPCLLYALDRYQVRDKLEAGLSSGTWFIADRYTQSNLGYQGAKFQGKERLQFITWLEAMEQRLPQPDLVIYLYLPIKIAQKLMEGRKQKKYLDPGKNQDIHELDLAYQQQVVETYLELAANRENWVVIECVDKKELKIKSIEKIHHDITQTVNNKLGI